MHFDIVTISRRMTIDLTLDTCTSKLTFEISDMLHYLHIHPAGTV